MANPQYSNFDIMRRARVLQMTLLASFLLLIAGLFFFQIAQGDTYVRLASRNRLRILRMTPPRGSIVDINGAPLAVNVRTFNINGYPVDLQREENIKSVTALLQRNGIPMDEEKFRELVAKQYSAPYRAITVATNLTFAQVAEMIMDRDFKNVLFPTPVWKRTYPAAQYAAHVVGYVAEITKEELEAAEEGIYRGGDSIGKNGVESKYEDILRGAAGEEVIEVDSRGRKLRDISYVRSTRGGDLTLTIDLAAQRYAAELMGNYRGAIIAMDVNDGGIRCLYSSPSYDPNPLTWGISNKEWAALTDHDERPMMNRAISGAYPPASTFKIITGASILENKIANRSTTVNCPGYYELGDRRFRCWRHSGHGRENIIAALRDSCDVYFYQLSTQLGIERLTKTAAKFGVGRRSGIDLTGEAAGTLAGPEWKKRRIKESWYGGDTVNYSIGQGYVLMTPLQVLRAYAALANGGKLLKPRLNSAAPVESEPLDVERSVLELLDDGIHEVTRSGTGRGASAYGVSLAGKTGTAQNSHGDDHAWFVGYAPADKPKYAVVAIAEAGRGGSSVAGPIVAKMLNFLINGKKYVPPAPPAETRTTPAAQDGSRGAAR
ncbi:MAG: penicillin-binding protein 2 [Synergistaceae bacterium]|nr:penicillin-binding protein 2 [Synergistaceae bacterium]